MFTSRSRMRQSLLALCCTAVSLVGQAATTGHSGAKQPNVLVIVADDMGYTDIGAFGGSDIHTPHIDSLASAGIRFSNFHAQPTCVPTRAELLTGVDHHLSGFGSHVMTEAQAGKPGYEGHLNGRVVTLAEVLAQQGYRTYLSGKWHLGEEPKYGPANHGFQESFTLLPGGASHYADAQAIQPSEPAIYVHNGKVVEKLPEDFYSTKDYTNWMLQWLERDRDSSQPFFAYLAYTAPHNPLQAPASSIAKYHGVYDAGYEVLREQRFKRLQELGLIGKEQKQAPWPKEVAAPWASLSESEQQNSRRDMEVYAAMIDYMDEQIGRVLELLERQGELDNTLILFFSDNGANGWPAKSYPSFTRAYYDSFNNALDNRGAPGSYISQGAGWATASSAAYDRFKIFVSEGGIRTPAIIKPVGGGAGGSISAEFTQVRDIVPTVLDLLGAEHPSVHDAKLAPLDGRSLLPLLQGKADELAPRRGTGYELHGLRAYFDGDWKAVQTLMPLGSGQWQLFNLRNDPGETQDLASQHPERLAAMREAHAQYEQDNGVIYSPPEGMAVVRKLYPGLIVLAFILSLGQCALALRGKPARRWLPVVSLLLKVGLLGLLFSQWRDQALLLLMLLSAMELLVALRGSRRRWRFLNALVFVLTLVLLWLLGSGQILRFVMQEYSFPS